MMKLGVVSVGGPGAKLILERAKKYFDEVELVNIKKLSTKVDSGKQVLYEGKPLKGFDCLYFKGSFRYELLQYTASHLLAGTVYLPLHASVFPTCHNKLLTLLRLQREGVAVPETYFCSNAEEARNVLQMVKYPIILKTPAGTQGKGVMVADSVESAKTLLDALETFGQAFIIQEYIDTGGTDIRAYVVGNKVVASMQRKAGKEEVRANIHQGGTGLAFELDYDTEQLAVKAAKAIKADVCGVDILQGVRPVVLEINATPGVEGISAATGKDVPDIVAKYLYEKTVEFRKEEKRGNVQNIMDDLNVQKVDSKEILTNLDIKMGRIRLPEVVTKVANFRDGEEVSLFIDKQEIAIKKNKVGR